MGRPTTRPRVKKCEPFLLTHVLQKALESGVTRPGENLADPQGACLAAVLELDHPTCVSQLSIAMTNYH